MTKKKFRFFIRSFIFLFIVFNVNPGFSQSQVNHFVLSNSLDVFLVPSVQSPEVQVFCTVKAGYGIQSSETTGFAELAAQLVVAETEDIGYQVNQDCVLFSFDAMPSGLFQKLEALSLRLMNHSFSENTLQSRFSQLKNEKQSWSQSAGGFLNAAMTSRVFSEKPWKYESGINAEYFCSVTSGKAREILEEIFELYYVPSNAALFVAGNFDSVKVEEFIKEHFSPWQNSPRSFLSYGESNYGDSRSSAVRTGEGQKKFVLVDEGFSDSLSQIVIQYPAERLDSNQSAIAATQVAALVLQNSSGFKDELVDPQCISTGILDQSLMNVSMVPYGEGASVVFQALSYPAISPAAAAQKIQEALQKKDWFDSKSVAHEKLAVQIGAEIRGNSVFDYARILAEYWVYGDQEFFDWIFREAQLVTPQKVVKAMSREPFVFVLCHPYIYNFYEKDFAEAGFETVTRKNAFWYGQTAEKAAEEKTDSADVSGKKQGIGGTNSALITKTELSNGIPVTLKVSSGTNNLSVCVRIKGGELKNSAVQRGLETLVTKAVAQNITLNCAQALGVDYERVSGFVSVESETDLLESRIVVTCSRLVADTVLNVLQDCMLFSEISSGQADELMQSFRSTWLSLSRDVNFQLYSAAMKNFFAGTKAGDFFECRTSLLGGVSIGMIRAAYANLLDMSRYSVTICAEDPEKYLTDFEQFFGKVDLLPDSMLLSGLKSVPDTLKIVPPVEESRIIVPVERIFTTDIKKENAVAPRELIPTTEFFDPVHFYCISSAFNEKNRAMSIALALQLCKQLNSVWKNGVSFDVFDYGSPVFAVVFEKADTGKKVQQIFEEQLLELAQTDFSDMTKLSELKENALQFLFAGSENGVAFEAAKADTGFYDEISVLEEASASDFAELAEVIAETLVVMQVETDGK